MDRVAEIPEDEMERLLPRCLEYPMQFNMGEKLNGKLYTISGHRGMWRYGGSWKRMARNLHLMYWNMTRHLIVGIL